MGPDGPRLVSCDTVPLKRTPLCGGAPQEAHDGRLGQPDGAPTRSDAARPSAGGRGVRVLTPDGEQMRQRASRERTGKRETPHRRRRPSPQALALGRDQTAAPSARHTDRKSDPRCKPHGGALRGRREDNIASSEMSGHARGPTGGTASGSAADAMVGLSGTQRHA